MNNDQLHELLHQALETELGGVEVYETALRCVKNDRSTTSRPRITSRS